MRHNAVDTQKTHTHNAQIIHRRLIDFRFI